MNKKLIYVLCFALTVATLASVLVYRLLVGHLDGASQSKTTRVLIASHDLPVGTVIREGDLEYSESAAGSAVRAISKPEDALGRGVLATIYTGEPIAEARLAVRGSGGGLAAIIPPGMRAAAVRVNEVVGVSGFVTPGMRVDVIGSGLPPDPAQRDLGTVTRTVLQNLMVLSAGKDLERDAKGKAVTVQVVNLLVSPEQAETLSLASTEAKVQLVLRNPLDETVTTPPGTNTASIFSGRRQAAAPEKPLVRRAAAAKPQSIGPAPPAPAPPPAPVTVEVLSGAKRETVTFGMASASAGATAQ